MPRYKMNFAVPGGEPLEALTLDDATPQWQIVAGREGVGEERTSAARVALEDALTRFPDAEVAQVLEEYFGMGSYTQTSDWTESPLDYEATLQRLKLELQEWINPAKVARRGGLSQVADAAHRTGIDQMGADDEIDDETWQAFQHNAWSGRSTPALSPERRAAAIAALEALIGGPAVTLDEEVFSEAEDVSRSEEGQ